MHKTVRKVVLGLIGMSICSQVYGSQWREPLPTFEPGEWHWVDIPDTYCRDGSSSGIQVNYSNSSSDLIIYLEGGGACFNNITCSINPSSATREPPPAEGIFSRSNDGNPFKDYNYIYIPYCTGDVYAGNRRNVDVSRSVENQQFVGYSNMTRFLQHIAPTFTDADKVVLSGISAGGFGALMNFDQAKQILGSVDLRLLDDSGIPFTDEYLESCLQSQWRQLWDMQFPEDCTECENEQGGGLSNYLLYLQEKYDDSQFAFISSLGDTTIRFFYGFGRNNCRVVIPSTRASDFRKGLFQMRDEVVQNRGNFFLFEGTTHTYLKKPLFYSTVSGGQAMNDFVSDYLNDRAQNRGPER
ncbi:MAG: hypothetical protein HRU19_04005 [Pseudobacteriovorax sp.]|nr:hypothetical protein [Pseudobacteriovorax sp.]